MVKALNKINNEDNRSAISMLVTITISILLHLVFFLLLPHTSNITSPVAHKDNPITVTRLTQPPKKEIKTVGKENGKKRDTFSMSVGQLAPPPHNIKQIMENMHTQNTKDTPKEKTHINSQTVPVNKYEVTNYNALSPPVQDALEMTDFNMNITPPKGVSIDALNETEKIFYSFFKRSYSKYVNSYVSTINELMTNKPYLKNKRVSSKHIMSAKVTYDKTGNVISIQVIRWSDDDDLQNIFQKTIEEIRNIPNPPKDLIQEDETFVIHYELHFNK